MSRRLAVATTVLLVLLFGLQTICQTMEAVHWGHESWAMTEWLINYAGGFVRRGLPGETLSILSGFTGVPANLLAIAGSLIVSAILLGYLLKNARGQFQPVLLFANITFGFAACQGALVRKDNLLLLIFLLCLRVRKSDWNKATRFIVLNLLACLAILTHEGFAFIALPALVVGFCNDEQALAWRRLARSVLMLLPTAACFALAAIHHGNPAIADAVNDSWMSLWKSIDPDGRDLATPAAAIAALGWSAEQGVGPGMNLLFSGTYQPFAWAILFGITFVLMLAFTGDDSAGTTAGQRQGTRMAGILIFQLVAISPLFLLGHDYGRWLYFWTISSLILLVEGFALPGTIRSRFAKLPGLAGFRGWLVRLRLHVAVLLFFGVPAVGNIHTFVTASPLLNIADRYFGIHHLIRP